MSKKSTVDLSAMPEVFVSNKALTSAVSKAVKFGRLRKIGTRLYSRNMTEAPEDLVRRHWFTLLGDYFPDALISDRTALENRPATDGSVYIISSSTRNVVLPGITFKPRRGHPPLDTDLPFMGVRLSSTPRAWLENMRLSRGPASRTLDKVEIEVRLDELLRSGGVDALNKLRDQARIVSDRLGMQVEFRVLDEILGAFLGTRDAELGSDVGVARQRGEPYDPNRVDLFMGLFEELRATAPSTRPSGHINDAARTNLAFFESYFSNYIEGTEFLVDEAMDIVFRGVIPRDRPADSHDILSTFRIVSDRNEMRRVPSNPNELTRLLKDRHAVLMGYRRDKKPGDFKVQSNRAGSTLFVEPTLVAGTLARGFEIHRSIDIPLHRAIYMMFLISEVHPFMDGNGRIARIMMNAELEFAGEQKIIIPTVYRNNYISALKALSNGGDGRPLIRVLDFAQRFTASIRWDDLKTARDSLEVAHSFLDSNEAEDKGLRLTIPR
jgi:hypothetical protein